MTVGFKGSMFVDQSRDGFLNTMDTYPRLHKKEYRANTAPFRRSKKPYSIHADGRKDLQFNVLHGKRQSDPASFNFKLGSTSSKWIALEISQITVIVNTIIPMETMMPNPINIPSITDQNLPAPSGDRRQETK
jgi:hypothetical protein